MTSIKLYGPVKSSGVQRVLVTLYEKNVEEFQIVPINLSNGENKTPEYLKLNPFGLVPALQYGALTLFESRAIARSVAHKFEGQGTALYGAIGKDRALVEQWIEVESQNLNGPLWEVVNNTGNPNSSLDKLEAVLDVYEKHLSSSKYLAGDFFSLADVVHLPNLQYLVTVAKRGAVLESRPAVKAWWEDISSRSAWQKTLKLAA